MRRKPTQIIDTGTVFVLVQYPYRKTRDLYVVIRGEPIFCAQCEATFDLDGFVVHVESHDRRNKRTAPQAAQKEEG